MIVHPPRPIPPTRDERRATVRARWRYAVRILDTLIAAAALPAAVLGLWLLTRSETGWAVTLVTLGGIAAARTCWRLMDPPAAYTPEGKP